MLQPLGIDEHPVPATQVPELHTGGSLHALGPHVTSHAHEPLHSTALSHEFAPLHVTVHGPDPHWTPLSHAPDPEQLTLQLVALPHVTELPQVLDALQPTTQSIPSGHSTSSHALAWLQSIKHVEYDI